MSNWTEDSINNVGFTQNDEEIVNPTPPAWGTTDPSTADTMLQLSNGWSLHIDDTLLDLTFKYGSDVHVAINDNGTIGFKSLNELPGDADIGSIALVDGKLYINEE